MYIFLMNLKNYIYIFNANDHEYDKKVRESQFWDTTSDVVYMKNMRKYTKKNTHN